MSEPPAPYRIPADSDELIKRRQRALGPACRMFYEQPLHIVKGEGVWLTDAGGRRYLDMYNNVPHVGHCHPHVTEAIRKQVRVLNTHTRYLHENVVDYAERLLGKLPAELDVAMFSCSGSEANELALRIAREATGGTGLMVIENAYLGDGNDTVIGNERAVRINLVRRKTKISEATHADCDQAITVSR